MEQRREDVSTDDLESTPAMRQARGRVGAVLRGKWKLDAMIGLGGMGAVYAATHRNGRRCAIKVLLPLHSADRKTVQRFLKEGYVANEIGHPDTVEIYDDDFTDDGLPFLVMELLEGQSLSERLEQPPHRLDAADAVRIGVELLDVLETAHTRGIVHRDVKPDNVFLLATGRLKLLDFGIARLRSMTVAGTTTASGALLGTPAFMAPEQARGRIDDVDARSDVFGVGATLFTVLSGQPVRDADTLSELLLQAMTLPAPALSTAAPHVRPELAGIVDRALSFAREGRWQSCAAMRDALLRLDGVAVVNASTAGRATGAPTPLRARITPGAEGARARSSLDATVAAAAPSTAPSAHPPPSIETSSLMPADGKPDAPARQRHLLFVGGGAVSLVLVSLLAWRGLTSSWRAPPRTPPALEAPAPPAAAPAPDDPGPPTSPSSFAVTSASPPAASAQPTASAPTPGVPRPPPASRPHGANGANGATSAAPISSSPAAGTSGPSTAPAPSASRDLFQRRL